ncbi:hypothetical protein J0H58_09685 [bacterium]|nr:hypothetical protein [bacterium]
MTATRKLMTKLTPAPVRVRNATCGRCRKPMYVTAGRLLVCRDRWCQPIPFELTRRAGGAS